jgi:Mce-associated membrane protein
MTNSTVSEDEMVDETEPTAGADETASDETATDETAPAESAESVEDAADDARPGRSLTQRLRPQRPQHLWRLVSAVLLAALIAGGGFGYVKYRELTGQLEQLRQTQADRDAAAQLAKDYALKSLTYTFEDPDAFFRAVEDGVSQQLKDKYVNATDLLKRVMLEAQVTSTGEVLATDPVAQPGGVYQVVVSAHQTTRNLQNPTPKVSIILLQVTVNKVGNALQVADIGPKTGAQRPVEQQLPPAQPPVAPPPPSHAPNPAPPAPRR